MIRRRIESSTRLINKAKPFHDDFDIQPEAAEKLYGERLKPSFTSADIETAFDAVKAYYPTEIITGAKNLLHNQRHTYGYFFCYLKN